MDSVHGTILESIFQDLNFRVLRVGVLGFEMIQDRFRVFVVYVFVGYNSVWRGIFCRNEPQDGYDF